MSSKASEIDTGIHFQTTYDTVQPIVSMPCFTLLDVRVSVWDENALFLFSQIDA